MVQKKGIEGGALQELTPVLNLSYYDFIFLILHFYLGVNSVEFKVDKQGTLWYFWRLCPVGTFLFERR